MIWSVTDAAFWRTLTVARRAFEVYGTLALPRSLVIDGVRIGQALTNYRRPGGLGSNTARAEERRRALESVDPEWNPQWPADWQRHYAAARDLLSEEQGATTAADILPGLTVNGADIGTWLARQTDPAVWEGLLPGQRTRLQALGLTPAPAPAAPAPVKVSAYEKGMTAFAQYVAREGTVTVPRHHIEETDAYGPVRLGIWYSNLRARRAKLTTAQRERLAALGVGWAQETT